MEDIELNNVKMVLDEYALKFQEFIKRKIVDKDKKASGSLLASISMSIEVFGERYTVYLHSKDYLKYIENGRGPGKFPPPDKILQWVKDKKLPTKESTGDKSLPSEKSLAYLVGRKISLYGTKPTPLVAETEEELNEIYMEKLEDALILDIQNSLSIVNIQIRFE